MKHFASAACVVGVYSCFLAFWAQGVTPLSGKQPVVPLELKMALPDAWDIAQDVLQRLGYEVERSDKAAGLVLTKAEEGVSGIYTASELGKVAEVKAGYQSLLCRGRYQLEITVQFLDPQRTSVAVAAKISGLVRDIDGVESWANMDSKGVLEKRYLNELSFRVTGKRPYVDDQPYWKKNSQEINIRN